MTNDWRTVKATIKQLPARAVKTRHEVKATTFKVFASKAKDMTSKVKVKDWTYKTKDNFDAIFFYQRQSPGSLYCSSK